MPCSCKGVQCGAGAAASSGSPRIDGGGGTHCGSDAANGGRHGQRDGCRCRGGDRVACSRLTSRPSRRHRVHGCSPLHLTWKRSSGTPGKTPRGENGGGGTLADRQPWQARLSRDIAPPEPSSTRAFFPKGRFIPQLAETDDLSGVHFHSPPNCRNWRECTRGRGACRAENSTSLRPDLPAPPSPPPPVLLPGLKGGVRKARARVIWVPTGRHDRAPAPPCIPSLGIGSSLPPLAPRLGQRVQDAPRAATSLSSVSARNSPSAPSARVGGKGR